MANHKLIKVGNKEHRTDKKIYRDRASKIKVIDMSLTSQKEMDNGIRYVEVIPGIKTDPLPVNYHEGAEGMIRWIHDFVCVSITPPGEYVERWMPMRDLPTDPDPKTGKRYSDIWEHQKNILRRALHMDDNGEFIHRLIVFCWMRGEGKSFLACLIQLWKFFCFPRQKIMLGANSKDQVKFVHYDIMREIILNSPKLRSHIGDANIQEKEIRLVNKATNGIESVIRSISSFSGIVSNITGYTFSEMFDMKNPKFFVQLDGSIRNITNAFGVIDSTVSEKSHILYQLYENTVLGKTKTVFFNYRYSVNADYQDYWNPKMDQDQLNDYQTKFPFGEFERYFKNTWEAGSTQIFTTPIIDEIQMLGCDGENMNHFRMQELLKQKEGYILKHKLLNDKGLGHQGESALDKIPQLLSRFTLIDTVYKLESFSSPDMATMQDLRELSDVFDTDWVILAGADIGDVLAVSGQANTVHAIVAKGYIHSRSNPLISINDNAPKYIYVLLHLSLIQGHSLDSMKEQAEHADTELGGIDNFSTERYGSWDIVKWCEERHIQHESIYPNYDRQKDAFKEFYTACEEGRFKAPKLRVRGVKGDDILREEMEHFQHDLSKKTFGSSEKFKRGGVQDDTMYAIAWAIYGGRNLGIDDFRKRGDAIHFGTFTPAEG